MSDRKRMIVLIFLLTSVALIVDGITLAILYDAAFKQQRARLVEIAQSKARMIEAVARFDQAHSDDTHPEGATAATIAQVIDAHEHYNGFGKTGEFVLARHEEDQIVFLLSHRHFDLDNPKPVPFDAKLAEPMRRALSKLSGTIVGLDYRGAMVLAAHAIEEQDDVTIETELLDTEILVRISDTGKGVPQENLQKLYDPFFTTKAVGKGTGLGLSISYGIIQKHNGNIQVLSEVGKGTTFTIHLPIAGVPVEDSTAHDLNG